MPVPIQFPDGWYDRTHTWQNASDRVDAERAFALDPVERRKIDAALATADPAVPGWAIQGWSEAQPVPPAEPTEPLTVMQCFAPDLGHVSDFAPTNFSGRRSEWQGSSIPSMPPW